MRRLGTAELYQPVTLAPPNLVSIVIRVSVNGSIVTPGPHPTISVGTAPHFIATDPNTGQQLASVTWSSSDKTVATISNDAGNLGTAFAVGTGTAAIKACAGTICGWITLTVQ